MSLPVGEQFFKQVLHVPKVDDYYPVSKTDLQLLANNGSGVSKDICIGSFGIGISCSLNTIPYWSPININLVLFLNSLFALVGIGFGIRYAFAWRKESKENENILAEILNSPPLPENVMIVTTGSYTKTISRTD